MSTTATPTGAALSGAASGAAAGTAIMPGWGTAVGAVVGGVGGYLSASGTQSAQNAQNKAGAQQAAAQSSQAWQNYLAARGINIQQLIAQFPDIQQEYQSALARGDKRTFDVWVYEALKAAPNHPIWDAIANPAGTAGAANTTLPAWAVDAQGKPLQPAVFQQLVNMASGRPNVTAGTPVATVMAELSKNADFAALPADWKQSIAEQVAANGLDSQLASNASWAAENAGTPEAEALARWSQSGGVASSATGPTAPAGPAGSGNNSTLDPGIAGLIPQATNTLKGVFDGTYLAEINKGLEPIAAARSAEAAAQAARIAEQRGLSGALLDTELAGIGGVTAARTAGAGGVFDASTAAARGVYDANVTKLADLLGVRREAAQQIYDASIAGAGGVRDARTTGAKGIYDAELLRADTYGQASEQALSRMLAQQGAERARRGFTGGSSGSNIVDARLTADYLQRGAGVRADAGVGYQGRLSDAGIGYATDSGRAGVGRATTIGQSNEADAAAKLTAAVDLAKSLGLAGTTRATTLAGTGEQDAIAQLQAKVADATRRLGYLTADADIAKANADLKNAQDALTALTNNQNRKIGAVGAPFSLAGMDLNLKGGLNDQKYLELDALLKRLPQFSINPASGPGLVTSTPGSVTNTAQIIGAGLSGLGTAATAYASNQSLQKQIEEMMKKYGGGGGGTYTPVDETWNFESVFSKG